MEESKMWEIVSEEKMKQVIAGYKSHCTRLVNQARTRNQKNKVREHYDAKIAEYLDATTRANLAAKRHNAAIKAWETMRSRKASTTNVKVTKMAVSSRKK